MTKHNLLFALFFCVIAIGGCNKNILNKKQINKQQKQTTEQENNVKQQNEIAISQEEAEEKYALKENIINEDPTGIVDNILLNPTQNIHIGIIAPMSGKYESVGNMLAEASLLTTSGSAYANSGVINIYDIGKLPDKDWQENKEVKRLLEDNNDVFIGSIFTDTTKKLLSVLPQDKPFISFINDNKLAKDYPNLTIASMNDGYKIVSMLQYLKDNNRKFLSLILPATNKGYQIDKTIRKLARQYKVIIVTTQFYQAGSSASILASARGINKRFSATYFIDENGHFFTETYKANKAKKQSNKGKKLEELTTTIAKTQNVETNALYIEAEEADLLLTLSHLERFGILNKDIQILSNAVFDLNSSGLTKLDNVLFVGYNYRFVDDFNKRFRVAFGHQPNYFAYITYDIITMLGYITNSGQLTPRFFYATDGYRGVLDEFRFTREGEIERRFGIYQLRNQNISKTYVPDDYITSNMLNIK